jgi:hypothetical protein
MVLGHTVDDPLIIPGVAGTLPVVVMFTDSVLAVLVPQLFTAFTDILPPAVPAFAVIELVVDEPVHPDGNVHAYAEAPFTAVTE